MTWPWPMGRDFEEERDVPWIEPRLGEPEGLIGVGGDLSPALLLRAYSEGVFPWFSEGDPVLWWSPDPRAIIELDGLHVSRRLARTIRSGKFRVTIDRQFEAVMRACGEARPDGTWVTDEMIAAYSRLNREGHAHSVEVWHPVEEAAGTAALPGWQLAEAAGTAALPGWQLAEAAGTAALPGWQLAGGIYGVAIGGLFAGESMFHTVTDASKVALAALVEHLKNRGYALFDVQMKTEHTERMGAVEIARDSYLARLQVAVAMGNVRFRDS